MVNDFAKELAKAMKDYTEDVTKGIEDAVDDVTKEMANEIKNTAPKKTGDYAKGWSQRKMQGGKGYERVVYNRTDYQLTHLIEKGFTMRNGKRKSGRPHIGPVEDKYIPELEDKIENVIKNGG